MCFGILTNLVFDLVHFESKPSSRSRNHTRSRKSRTRPGVHLNKVRETMASNAVTPAAEEVMQESSSNAANIVASKTDSESDYIKADAVNHELPETESNSEDEKSSQSDIQFNNVPAPPAPPLPSFSKAAPQPRRESHGATTTTTKSSTDSEGRHLCPNGIAYPALDELLKYGRITRNQLQQVEEQFNCEQHHCLSQFICEGIYHSSQITSSDRPTIEDYVPLARNEFNRNLTMAVDNFYRQRSTRQYTPKETSSQSNRQKRVNPLRNRKSLQLEVIPSTPSSDIQSTTNDNLSVIRPTSISEVQSAQNSLELTSPQRQRANRVEAHLDESDQETTRPRRSNRDHSHRHFKPSGNLRECMIQALEVCSLPHIFVDVELTFLHYIHQSLYSLHLRSHVKTQSYPKLDILDLLISGRDLCDLGRRQRGNLAHSKLLKLFLQETFSTRSRKVKSNCFQVPLLRRNQTVTSELIHEALSRYHEQYRIRWSHTFQLMVTPPFI